jgi:PAS domain S-box-containing protein/putative nucleotidyltransferase with HDIG domain
VSFVPGTLHIIFYLIPDEAYDQILEALSRFGYTPEGLRVQDPDSLQKALNPTVEVILAGVFGSSKGPLQAQEFVRARQLNIPIIAVADPGSQAILLECLQQGIADCVNMEYLNCLAPAMLRALRYQQLELQKNKVEGALRQERDLLNRITNTAPAGIMVRNPHGQILFANLYAQQLLRLTLVEGSPPIFQPPPWKVTDFDGGFFPDEQLPFSQVLATGLPVSTIRHAIQLGDEQIIYVSANAAPIFSPDGHIDSIVTTIEDITEQVNIQSALSQEHARAQQYLDIAEVILVALDGQGRISMINPSGCRTLGYTEEELLGKDWFDTCLPANIRPKVRQIFNQMMAGEMENTSYYENKVLTSTGEERITAWHNTLLRDAQGKILGSLSSGEDITRRRQAENTIQSILKGTSAVGAEFFRSLVRELAAAVQVRYALVGQLIPGDPYRIRTVALCADGQIADNIEYDLAGAACEGEDCSQISGTAPCFFPNGVQQMFPSEHPLVKMGAVCYLGVPLFATDGMPLGHIAMIHDQPMAESELAKSLLAIFATRAGAELERMDAEEKYLSVIENVSEGIFQSTPEGHFIFANTSLAQMLGYDTADDLTSLVSDIPLQLYVNPEDRFVWQDALKKQDIIQGFEVQLYKRDGSKFWIAQNVHAVRDPSGNLIYYEGTVIDITARREAEETIRQNAARAHALDAVSRTLAESGLDYRTMLNNVARRLSEMIGDLCEINLISEKDQTIELTALHHPDPRVTQDVLELRRRLPSRIDEGLSGKVLKSGQPQVSSVKSRTLRQTTPPEYHDFLEKHGFHSMIAAPIRAQNHTYGTLVISRGRSKAEFSREDARFLDELSNRVGMAITNALLLNETERRLRYVQALRDIDVAITSSLELSITLNIVLEQVTTQLETDTAAILLLNPHLQTLNFAAGRGFRTNAIQRTRLRLGESYAGRAALERKTICIPDLKGDPLEPNLSANIPGENFAAYFGTPLLAKGQIKGVLEIFHRTPLQPDDEWLSFFEMLARQAAIAIDNASLFAELQRSNTDLIMAYDATIEGWSRALDLRDRETEGHTQRVTLLTEQLAMRLGVSDAQLVHIRRGALLHDIGKMGVPDSILHKNTDLSEEEWQIMRQHPKYAFELLLPVNYLQPALDIPYNHHERWDGQGYPRQLKGEQIPLAARIFAVVDVWDALTSDRPYHPAWAEDDAMEYLRAHSGTRFDPRVVAEFTKMMSELPAEEPPMEGKEGT